MDSPATDATPRRLPSDIETPTTPNDEDAMLLAQDGYAWDYVLVFPNGRRKTTATPLSPLSPLVEEVIHRFLTKKNLDNPTVDEICHRLTLAGLRIKLVSGTKSGHIFCLVRASPERLAREADRIDLNMLMDEDGLREVSHRGFPTQGIAPFPIQDSLHIYRLSPYASIYFKYTCRDDMQSLYVKHRSSTLFSSSQRMLLLESIMTNRHGGAGLDLLKLDHADVLTTYFPLHDEAEKTQLADTWLSTSGWRPWRQPLSEIQAYFGSRIGLYFGFLGHYTTWLVGAGGLGCLLWIMEWTSLLPSAVVVWLSSVLIIFWACFFLKSWRRATSRLAMQWGTSDFSAVEQVRPQYIGEIVPSPITGQPMLYFSRREKRRRRILTWLLLCALMALVIGVVCTIFYLQYLMLERGYSVNLAGSEVALAGPVASIANVVQINVMYTLYDALCEAMNDYENHRTESTHEGSFITKSVLFYLVNNFAGLGYITFVKGYVGIRCADDNCKGELRLSLLTIFCVQLINALTQGLLLPWLRRVYSKCGLRLSSKQDHDVNPVEKQFALLDYSWKATFKAYLALAMQFGFTILFVGASPAMPMLSMLNNTIEMRTDATTLLQNHRRPSPRQASTSGKWVVVLEYLVTLAIVTNGFVTIYTSNSLGFVSNDPHASLSKLRAFIGFATALLAVRYGVAAWINDVPHEVAVQLKRQTFLAAKIYSREADDAVPVFESMASVRLIPLTHQPSPV
ncbi:hypothetical protein AeMF1_003833 [Aphanomyces euteiches]|nr:hypothetical protein AeMF1_003833 [Aphanomyces euteiches]KAH9189498.1 hypothetical protein AeNC1_008526 [Aphanomyces euteiches]